MSNSENRRKFARVELAARVRVEFPDRNERRQLLFKNLSQNGLFLATSSPKPVGTRLVFEFSVQDGAPSIRGTGVVKWIETDLTKTSGMGIQFLDLNPEGEKEIAELLKNREASDDGPSGN